MMLLGLSVCRSVSQSVGLSAFRSVSQSVCLSVDWPVGSSVGRLVSRSLTEAD